MYVLTESSILGYTEQSPKRRIIVTSPTGVPDVLAMMPRLGWTKGVVSREAPWAGARKPIRHLDFVRIAPNGLVTHGDIKGDEARLDFTFSPTSRVPKLKNLKLWQRAVERKLPYVYVYDDDHAWWYGLKPVQQRALFGCWLFRSALRSTISNPLVISADCWRAVRSGLSVHGWTVSSQPIRGHHDNFRVELEARSSIPLVDRDCDKSSRAIFLRIDMPSDGYREIHIGLDS